MSLLVSSITSGACTNTQESAGVPLVPLGQPEEDLIVLSQSLVLVAPPEIVIKRVINQSLLIDDANIKHVRLTNFSFQSLNFGFLCCQFYP